MTQEARAASRPFEVAWQRLAATRAFLEVAISPDGGRVAWVEAIYAKGVDTGHTAIHIRSLGTADAAGATVSIAAVKKHTASERQVAWSPDGERIAFLSDAARPGQMQLYVASVPAGAKVGTARALTRLNGFMTAPQWSPDGRRIGFLFAHNAASGGGPLRPVPVETGVIGAAIHNQRWCVVGSSGGRVQTVSPEDLNIYEFGWAPDSRRAVMIAGPGPADNNWWVAQLYTQGLADTAPKLVSRRRDPQAQIAMPRWSPDGRTLAWIQGLMSDQGFNGGDLWTVAATGGKPVNRTAAARYTVNAATWLGPGVLGLTAYAGGGSRVMRFDMDRRGVAVLWESDQGLHAGGNFSNFSWSQDGTRAAMIRSGWGQPPEIYAGPVGKFRPVTAVNRGLRPAWGEVRSLTWRRAGFTMQGWLLAPRTVRQGKKYPMVVAVHGGPASVKTSQWPGGGFEPSLLSALGYYVFFPNPRGSYGQGQAFTRANVQDFGHGDLDDILAGVDAVLASAPVDGRRLGITGWSYGGFMTMWALTQAQRFRAAVAGAGIANWLSYTGMNSIDQWMRPYFGASVYEDPEVYERSSPMAFIRRVKTPTLVVVGERDGECPAPQSYEYWHALKALGVPTELVVYAGEGHRFRQTANRRDVIERAAAWFDRYLS